MAPPSRPQLDLAIECVKQVVDTVAPGGSLAVSALVKLVGPTLRARQERAFEEFAARLLYGQEAQENEEQVAYRLAEYASNESFVNVLALLARDLQQEKAKLYALAFLQLDRVEKELRSDFVAAVGELRMEDMRVARRARTAGTTWKKASVSAERAASIRRLESTGVFDPQDGTKPPQLSEFGRTFIELLESEVS